MSFKRRGLSTCLPSSLVSLKMNALTWKRKRPTQGMRLRCCLKISRRRLVKQPRHAPRSLRQRQKHCRAALMRKAIFRIPPQPVTMIPSTLLISVQPASKKSSDFAARQQLRAEEIAAVEKAIEILSSGAVSGASEKHLPQLLQTKTSLAQLRSVAQNPNQLRVAAYLKGQASRINSRVLSALAMRVADDPFKKVKKMIKDLIVKLMEEANEEAEHKGWCDTELSTNEQTRKEKTEAVETLHAEIDQLQASIAKLTEDISQ